MPAFDANQLTLLKRLGAGASTEVDLAALADGRRVVVRRLRTEMRDEAAHALTLEEEAALLMRLEHPGLRRCLGYDAAERAQVLEYVDGAPLAAYLEVMRQRGQRFEPARALDVIEPLADTLAYLHTHDVCHLDVTPDNVLIDRGGRVLLTDLARGSWPERRTIVVRAPIPAKLGYTAPELWLARPLGPPADVYSLGVVLWEILAGEAPRFASPPRRGDALPPLVPLVRLRDALPPPLFMLVHRLTARDPAARPATGPELTGLLQAARQSL